MKLSTCPGVQVKYSIQRLVSSLAIFMLHMLQLVLVVFRPFPKPTGNSMQHERDMEHDLPPRPADFQDAFI
jgi:hypothetical protein